MALIDELKEKRAASVAYRDQQFEDAIACNRRGSQAQYHIDDLDRAIAALEPAPAEPQQSEGVRQFTAEVIRSETRDEGEVPAPQDEPSLFDAEGGGSVYGADAAYEDGVEARLQNVPLECNPGEGVDATEWANGWNAEDAATTSNEQSDADLLNELDAPASIVDDPELQAAVARAEQALAIDAQTCEPIYPHPQPAYVGLQDPELDADYDAMRERETADRKLHFSIFGKR